MRGTEAAAGSSSPRTVRTSATTMAATSTRTGTNRFMRVEASRESLRKSEQPRGVLLEHERADLVADRDLLEVVEPAVGRDQREVRAEEHLVLEPAVRVLDQVGREVLG